MRWKHSFIPPFSHPLIHLSFHALIHPSIHVIHWFIHSLIWGCATIGIDIQSPSIVATCTWRLRLCKGWRWSCLPGKWQCVVHPLSKIILWRNSFHHGNGIWHFFYQKAFPPHIWMESRCANGATHKPCRLSDHVHERGLAKTEVPSDFKNMLFDFLGTPWLFLHMGSHCCWPPSQNRLPPTKSQRDLQRCEHQVSKQINDRFFSTTVLF